VSTTAISNSSASQAQQAQTSQAQVKAQQQKSQQAQKTAQPQNKDTVTLSPAARQSASSATKNGVPAKTPSTGDVDHDGDSH